MRARYIYHGSPKKIKGDLIPKKATGLGNKKGKLVGVYATHKKDAAIIMAMISGKNNSSLRNAATKPRGIIYGGSINKNVWLYVLPSSSFKKLDSWQWVSYKKVKPVKVEKIDIKKYMPRVRMASDKEKRDWYKKFKQELKSKPRKRK